MVETEQVFIALMVILGIIVFGLPFVGGPATATVFGVIQLGVAVAWAATVVLPVLILVNQFAGSGREA